MKISIKFLALFICISSFWGCAESENMSRYGDVSHNESRVTREAMSPEAESAVAFVSSKITNADYDGEKKFVRTANLQMSVHNVLDASHKIEDIAISKKGFIIHSEIQNSRAYNSEERRLSADSVVIINHSRPVAQLSLRVPHNLLDETLREIAMQAQELFHRDLKAKDVSFDFIANELSQKREAEHKLLLDKIMGGVVNDKLEDILAGADALNEANKARDEAHIASLRLEDDIEYSQINLSIEPIASQIFTSVQYQKMPESYRVGFWFSIKSALLSGWYGLVDLVIFLISIWYVLIIVGALIYGGVRYRRRRRERKSLK